MTVKKVCDLHTHSVFSDGTYTPRELIDAAIKVGLSAVALCDHNTVDGLEEFLSAAEGKNIDPVAGCEFSADLNGVEIHLLGLYIPRKNIHKVSELMRAVKVRKEQSNIDLVHSLNRAGYKIDYDGIKKESPRGNINRAHIAAELTEKGYTKSIDEAFGTLLSPKAGYYHEPERLTVWEILDFLRSIDAVPVLAHPFLNLTEEQLAEFLPRAKNAGLVGMECYYSLYDAETSEKSLKMAETFGLLPSGGSDFHGTNKPDIAPGRGKGNLAVPYEWATALKAYAQN